GRPAAGAGTTDRRAGPGLRGGRYRGGKRGGADFPHRGQGRARGARLPGGGRRRGERAEQRGMSTAAGGADVLTVALGERAYPIVIGAGLIDNADAHLPAALGRGRAFVLSDETVADLYLAPFAAALDRAGIARETVVVPPGEGSKDFATFERVVEACLARRIE